MERDGERDCKLGKVRYSKIGGFAWLGAGEKKKIRGFGFNNRHSMNKNQ